MMLPYAGRVVVQVGAASGGAVHRRAVVVLGIPAAVAVSGVGSRVPLAVLSIGQTRAARKPFA